MEIKFTKMQSLGNDFVVIDATRQNINLNSQQIQSMADRRLGIGFDQLLILAPTDKVGCDFNYRIFNADGSEVGQCGNGACCIGRFIQLNNLSDKDEWVLATQTAKIKLALMGNELSVEMPIPIVLPKVDDALAALDLGNPHLVFCVTELDELNLEQTAALYAHHPVFPEGVNVGFMQVLDAQHIRLRVYERGAGATLACGSGACAAVVAGCLQGLLSNEVQVDQRGGTCWVSWSGESQAVYLRGPADYCFSGFWPYE